MEKSDAQFYWDWIIHEDNLFTNRANFFFVAEAMLLTGIAALISGDVSECVINVYLFAGIFTTFLWLYISVVHFLGTINPIKEKLRKCLPQYAQITEHRRKWGSIHLLIGITLPIVILAVWLILLLVFNDFG